MRRKSITIIILFIAIITVSFFAYYFLSSSRSPSVEYRNEDYGFSISLPLSWEKYSVTIDKWTGYSIGDELGEAPFTDGPVVSIHNPKWTEINSYQDIPIMVFTIRQWELLSQDKFHIGAALIGPSELGRNSKYVFGLPARYNYSFPLGYEEVDQIIKSSPLKTF